MQHISYYFSQIPSMMGSLHGGQRLGQPQSATWQPPVDVYEREDAIVIVVELPGVEKEQISVLVEGDVLKISGVRATRVPDGTRHVHQMEIAYGHFARYLRLSPAINPERINAEYKDGYLTIEIPRLTSESGSSLEAQEPEEDGQ